MWAAALTAMSDAVSHNSLPQLIISGIPVLVYFLVYRLGYLAIGDIEILVRSERHGSDYGHWLEATADDWLTPFAKYGIPWPGQGEIPGVHLGNSAAWRIEIVIFSQIKVSGLRPGYLPFGC
jgi:hypothetical protein